MTKLVTYRCNRCANIEHLTEKDRITLRILLENKEYDLCEDCNMIINFTLLDKNKKIVDKAINQFFEKLEKEG